MNDIDLPIRYHSTRGVDLNRDFNSVILGGLASDGGLYVPDKLPKISFKSIAAMAGQPYWQSALQVIEPFIGGDPQKLARLIRNAYGGFRHKVVAPVSQIADDLFLLELYHGPTMAFKDIAMQFLAPVMDMILQDRGGGGLTIVGATSGDTGSAAIEAFKNAQAIELFMIHPKGRISDIQRLQMTTCKADNIHNIALEGTFDDCQAMVKNLFGDEKFRRTVSMSAVNSINWGRIIAQVGYYFTAAVALGAPHRPVSFTVPTGNFGDVYAGFIAKQMGLPIDKLVIATNSNDIIVRSLDTGSYRPGEVAKTASPSMDIQVSSNFERIIHNSLKANDGCLSAGQTTKRLFRVLTQTGSFSLPKQSLDYFSRHFAAGRASEQQTSQAIASVWHQTNRLIDPHTAVGIHVGRRYVERLSEQTKTAMIVLATASPAKFPQAVFDATGKWPGLPEDLQDLNNRPERVEVIANDQNMVKSFILERIGKTTDYYR